MVIEFKFCNGQRLLNCVLNWKNWITVNLAKKEVKHKHFSHLLRSFNYIFYLPNFPNFRCLFNYFWLFSKCLFSKRWIDHVAKTVALPFNASTNSAKHSTRREFGRQQIRAVLARRKRERARRLGAVFWEATANDACVWASHSLLLQCFGGSVDCLIAGGGQSSFRMQFPFGPIK